MSQPLNSFESAFYGHLHQRIEEDAKRVAGEMISGFALGGDATATVQKYSEAVGYYKGLQAVLRMCSDVQDHLMGRGKR